MPISNYRLRLAASIGLLLFFVFHVVSFLMAFPKFIKSSRNFDERYPGVEFADLKEKLPGQATVGFLTDKDMSPERNDGQFLAAQYILAPIVLDLNNDRHTYLIFDCLDPLSVSQMTQKLSATIIATNPYNKTLAVKNP